MRGGREGRRERGEEEEEMGEKKGGDREKWKREGKGGRDHQSNLLYAATWTLSGRVGI